MKPINMCVTTPCSTVGSRPEGEEPSLALITPARNEATFIRDTLECVIAQTQRPVRWVIVSDGSTDATDDIVKEYARKYDWIEYLRAPERKERHFAGKVHAFNAGLEALRDLEYDVIGNLDADITFDEDYLAFLLGQFMKYPKLGVAGTPFTEGGEQYNYRFTSSTHVSGACQLFRRRCFQEIGGYVPIAIGGIDLVAVLTARLKGWQTRTFLEKTCRHHRSIGTAKQNRLMVAFRGGKGDYMLGTHPLWELCRTPYQMTRRPFVLAGCLRLLGFAWSMAMRSTILVPTDVIAFRRREQMQRLWNFITGPAPAKQGESPAEM